MLGYIARRIAGALLTVFVVATLAFVIMSIIPGDAAFYVLGEEATGADILQFRERLGLNDPVHVRLGRWYWSLVHGDLGESITHAGESVASLILARLEPTIILAVFASTVGIILGLTTGVLAAVWRGGPIDFACMIIALLGISVPNFWLALNLILVFSLKLRLLPVAGYVPISEGFLQTLQHLLLPALALGVSQSAVIARMTRANLLQVLSEDYMRTARSKGVHEWRVIVFHGLRNSMIPTLGVIGISVALVLGGAIISEIIFVIPGLGSLTVNSILRRDYPVLQGILMLVAFLTAGVNLAIDLLYGVLDPRIRYT